MIENAFAYWFYHGVCYDDFSFRKIKELVSEKELTYPIYVMRSDTDNFRMTYEEIMTIENEDNSPEQAKEILERHSWMIINDDKELEEAIEKEEN